MSDAWADKSKGRQSETKGLGSRVGGRGSVRADSSSASDLISGTSRTSAPSLRLCVSASLRPAFTLVELTVVIVILGVIAGLVGPRMVRRDSRQADQTVGRVASLLDSAARRVAMSSDPVQIEFDDEAREIRVLSRVRDEGFRQSWDRRERWHVDPLIPPVALGEVQVGEVMLGYRRIRDKAWRIQFGGAGGTPSVSIDFRTDSPAREWKVVLDGASGRAVAGSLKDFATMAPTFVDLDDAGKRRAPW